MCFQPGSSVFGHGLFVVRGHHFRSTFIASCCKYMINNECIKGEEVPGSDTFDLRISYSSPLLSSLFIYILYLEAINVLLKW